MMVKKAVVFLAVAATLLTAFRFVFLKTYLDHEVCLEPGFTSCLSERRMVPEDYPGLTHTVRVKLHAVEVPFFGKYPVYWTVYMFRIGDDFFNLDESVAFSRWRTRRSSQHMGETKSMAWNSEGEIRVRIDIKDGARSFWVKLRREE